MTTPATVVISLSGPVVAIVIAIWGFRRTSRADRIRTFLDLHAYYVAPEQRRGRRMLHEQLAGRSQKEVQALSDDLRGAAGAALASLNTIAIAIEAGQIRLALVQDSMGRSYSSAVQAGKAYIDCVEAERGYRPYQFAERLARRLGDG